MIETNNQIVFDSVIFSASLGGNCGLFLGMSILTALEFIDFFFRRICFIIWKHENKEE